MMFIDQEDAFSVKLAGDICSTMDGLKEELGLTITIHLLSARLTPCWYYFLPYNNHENIYCMHIKNCQGAWQHCIECQGKVLARARERGNYAGICWAGCLEAVFPLKSSFGEAEAFLSVSGFRAPEKEAKSRIYRVCKQYDLNQRKMEKAYETFRSDSPDMERLTRMLTPFQYMFMMLFDRNNSLPDRRENDSVRYHDILSHLRRNFSQKITIGDLAQKYHCSYSHISHMFRKSGNETLTRTLNRIRIDAARKYLEYTEESVSEIAVSVGFDDPNYFSFIFHRETGLSPTQWRAEHKSIPGVLQKF
ncbi:MAG: AraC family transcriptional regulator [Lachnospiraceae bacterium]|nr:AraC family transcriptional regulator [Lachnospiraceae bacterium]